MGSERKDFCNACGQELPPLGPAGPCPHCHTDAGRRIELVSKDDVRTWREWRWSILILATILTIASAVTGMGGPVGVAAGVVLGLIGTIIGFWATTNHLESETTRF